ncbi:MAG: hypothetical protein D6698_16725 [Gammaproteobacteria bacterium]|nr:MAG: hypothetical protein D6698_16725 [Gammaproteobacteria bacterium]
MQAQDGMATAQVRFRLETDALVTFDGFHVDDVAITVPNTGIPAHSASDYAFLNGTSMATPHVAGAAALVWAAEIAAGNPGITHLQVRDRLLNNGDALAALTGITVTGKRINVQMSMPLHAATGLAATVVSAMQVDLVWTDNSVSESKYRIERDIGTGFVSLARIRSNSQAYSDTTAPSSTTISYRVVAVGRDGRTVASTPVSVSTPAAPPPPSGGGGGGGGCLLSIPAGSPVLLTFCILFIGIVAVRNGRRI